MSGGTAIERPQGGSTGLLVQFEDTTRIDTPEGISLELTLAGLGSRAVAQLIDTMLKVVAAIVLVWISSAAADSMLTVSGVVAVLLFTGLFVYDIVLETFWGGRTVGKSATGLRVVRTDGSPITFFPSVTRNLMRIIDILPGPYGVGGMSILVTKANQRLGDLAAGTIVVRERAEAASIPAAAVSRALPPGFDATAITADQLALARHYLTRRGDLDSLTRRKLAVQVADALRPSLGPNLDHIDPEALVEMVVVAKDR
jgi:uncharacterized RDD family membrane protein YckC